MQEHSCCFEIVCTLVIFQTQHKDRTINLPQHFGIVLVVFQPWSQWRPVITSFCCQDGARVFHRVVSQLHYLFQIRMDFVFWYQWTCGVKQSISLQFWSRYKVPENALLIRRLRIVLFIFFGISRMKKNLALGSSKILRFEICVYYAPKTFYKWEFLSWSRELQYDSKNMKGPILRYFQCFISKIEFLKRVRNQLKA